MSLRVEVNHMDAEMLNIYSLRNDKYILWAVVHIDMLSELGLSEINDAEYIELKQVSYEYYR